MTRATAAGLALALAGPALVPFAAAAVGGGPVAQSLAGQALLWALVGAVLAIALVAERAPLASLGLRAPRLSSLLWGLGLAAALAVVVTPLAVRLASALGLGGFESGIATVAAWPRWLRIAAVLTGGSAEEVLYRGYALTRLERPLGPALAAALSVSIFALAHAPLWGAGPVVTFLVSGGCLAAFFLWRRDLVAYVVAHVVVDALGLGVFQ